MALDILIVDDSAASRKAVQRVLKQSGIPIGRMYEAGDGSEVLEVLRNHPVSLILSDRNMPGMDGFGLLAAVQAEPAWKDIPVIMMTVEADQVQANQAVQLGAAGWVRKPFTAEQIREKLRAFF